MTQTECDTQFPALNRAYSRVFQRNRLTLGVVVPIEAYPHRVEPDMIRHIERAQLVEALGFSALWLRDVPFNVPSFGDAGQIYDPFVYAGLLSGMTRDIALGIASVILPLRHPAHVAKAAASIDQLSKGRMLMGVASGDRGAEYPAMALDHQNRGERFRESIDYIRAVAEPYPIFQNAFGDLAGQMDLLPKPASRRIPLLITGSSQQTPDWVARHGDGWITYPRDVKTQEKIVQDYRAGSAGAGAVFKPVMQSLYIDVQPDPDAPARPIHLGFQSGVNFLKRYLADLEQSGLNHVALNLRFNQTDVEKTLSLLAETILPFFPTVRN